MRRSNADDSRAQSARLEERLRRALSWPDGEHGSREGVDMSPASITHRLMEAAAMSSLCLELAAIGEAGGG